MGSETTPSAARDPSARRRQPCWRGATRYRCYADGDCTLVQRNRSHDTAESTHTRHTHLSAQATGRVIVTTRRAHARAELAGDVASHRRRVAAAAPSGAHGATARPTGAKTMYARATLQ